jgi:RNA polymerase sigma factor (sigma-70 family)
MRDSEIVTAIVTGDPAGLAAAYDRYAAALHAYCRSMLTEPADAADAVQDTFVIAAAMLEGLSDPDRLRPWLYAVARNECHRRRRSQAGTSGLDEVAEVTDEVVEVDPEHAGLAELVSAAIEGLSPGEREIIELNLRQELHGDDLAAVLGVPRNRARALAARARGQFGTSLGVLLAARSGRASCAKLDELLTDWDGQLTAPLRKRLVRHIEHCDGCGQRKRRELQPSMLLSLLPVAVLPDGLWDRMIRLIDSETPDDAAHRERVAQRAEPFEESSGFPVAIDPPQPPPAGDRRRLLAVAAVAVFAVLCGVLIEAIAHHQPRQPASPVALGTPTLVPRASTSSAGSATGRRTSASPSASNSITASIAITSPGSTLPVSRSPSPTVRPSSSSSGPPTTPAGTLTESPSTVGLGPGPGGGSPSGSFTLTANGRSISYTITVPAGYQPTLVVSPASGTLAAGGSVTISVTWNSSAPLDTQLSVAPGGLAVTVMYPALG